MRGNYTQLTAATPYWHPTANPKVPLRVCRAKYDYKPTQQDDIGMNQQELLYLLAERPDGWTQALSLHGQVGFVPTSYIEEVPFDSMPFAPATKREVVRSKPGEPLGMSLAGGSPVYVDDVSWKRLDFEAGIRLTLIYFLLHLL